MSLSAIDPREAVLNVARALLFMRELRCFAVPVALTLTMTGLAPSVALATGPSNDRRVVGGERMAPQAMRLPSGNRSGAVGSLVVDVLRHRLQVIRVDAQWDLTEVVEFQTLGDWSDQVLPYGAMRGLGGALNSDEPVAVFGDVTLPRPAHTTVADRRHQVTPQRSFSVCLGWWHAHQTNGVAR